MRNCFRGDWHCSRSDLFCTGRGSFVNANETATAKYSDAMALRENFGKIGTDEYDRMTRVRQTAQKGVNLGLGSDIDSARRFIKNERLGLAGQPAPENDFLLVAAR